MKKFLTSIAFLCSIVSTTTFAEFNMDTRLLLLQDEYLDLGNGVNASADVLMEFAEDGRFNLVSFTIKNEWRENENGSTTNMNYNVCTFYINKETLEVEGMPHYGTVESARYYQARNLLQYPETTIEYNFASATGDNLCSFGLYDQYHYDPETGVVTKL